MDYATLTDKQLVRWATRFGGWKYFTMNDQLRDPQGGLTTANGWDNIGAGRRENIISQMQESATEAQVSQILGT